MFLYRKNIILVPSDYDGFSLAKGILSFDCYDNKTKCFLKCYNLNFDKNLVLGVSINKKLFKMDLSSNEAKDFEFEINLPTQNTDEMSCVVLDIKKADYDIVLWGSTVLNSSWKTSMQMMLEDENVLPKQKDSAFKTDAQNDTKKDEYEVSNTGHIDQKFFERNDLDTGTVTPQFNRKEQAENIGKVFASSENGVDKNNENATKNVAEQSILKDENLNNFVNQVIDMADEEPSKDVEPPQEPNFFDRIKLQIDKMMNTNPKEKVLNEIIPNSKFCKVEFDDKTGYYVFGIIYNEDTPQYLCYGVPSKRDDPPPQELSEYYQWLPIDVENNESDGFYMMYQDAETGKTISVDII